MNGETPPLTIDLEKLLSPISVRNPAGEYLMYDPVYDRIQEARREDDATLPQGIWETPLKKADWKAVADLSLDALETRSKDLQLAVWLKEAWMHLHGMDGVREGLNLLTGLCQDFWESLYPEWNADDPDFRLAPLNWMNDKLSQKLKEIPLTHPKSSTAGNYTLIDWEAALFLESQAQRDSSIMKAAEKEGKVTRSKFQGGVMLTAKSFYARLDRDLKEIEELVQKLERFLVEKCGNQAVNLRQYRKVLQDIHNLVNRVLLDRKEEIDETEPAPAPPEVPSIVEPAPVAEVSAGSRSVQIRSRSEAYFLLSEAAEYLIRTEPHSPTPYLVKRAVSWGSMSLSELLVEIVNTPSDLQAIYTLLGVKDVPEKK